MEPEDDIKAYFSRQIDERLNRFFSVAMRLTRNRADAEDLVADAIVRAWENIHTLMDRERFAPWFTRIMTNGFISRKRKAENRFTHLSYADEHDEDESFSLFEQLHQPFLLWWGNPEQQFLNGVMRADIDKALDALPENHRVMIVLSDVEGLTYQEIAHALSLPLGTVRSRLSRARAHLQRRLWMYATERDSNPAGDQEGDHE